MALIPAKKLGDERIVWVLLETDLQEVAQKEMGRKLTEQELEKIQNWMEHWLGHDWWEGVKEGIEELIGPEYVICFRTVEDYVGEMYACERDEALKIANDLVDESKDKKGHTLKSVWVECDGVDITGNLLTNNSK